MPSVLFKAAPLLFVLLWSTGFVSAKVTTPFAGALVILSLRFVFAMAAFALWALIARAAMPTRRQAIDAFLIGILIHGVYLGSVFWAIEKGLPAGPAALIVGLQPILTALFSERLTGEVLTPRQWVGVLLGFAGVFIVLAPKLGTGPDSWPILGVLLCLVGLVGITLASAYQKRVSDGGAQRARNVIQYLGGFTLVLPGALIFQPLTIEWTSPFILGLAWMVLVLSLGVYTLYQFLLSRDALVATVSLFYLVPVCTAVMSYFMFGEVLTLLQLLGMGVAIVGVVLVTSATNGHRGTAPGG